MKLYESGENYLETILILSERNGRVRSVDVAAELEFSKPSVSRAIGILRKEGLIEVDEGGWIELTEAGKACADAVLSRHKAIAGFLRDVLGVDADAAEEDACRIEHIISEETFEKMREKLLASGESKDFV
jgi:Mn-dependent DtxR family transcriptional regulator